MDDIFGVSQKALELCEDRAEIITSNMVNSATPHYKARDINFRGLLKEQDTMAKANQLMVTHPNDLQITDATEEGVPTLYRLPMQRSLDGNTVDDEIERKNFIENAMNYQVNLTYVQNKTQEIMKAIKGE